MILINLLPHELRPIQHSPVPYVASVLVLFLAVAAMGWLFVGGETALARENRELEDTKARLSDVADVVEEYNELSKKKLMLDSKITIIKEILSDRIIWSEQLHRLVSLTPDNIWYKRIRVVWQASKQQRPKKDNKTGKIMVDPKTNREIMETVTLRRPILEVSGYAVEDEQGQDRVSPLTVNTTRDPGFSSMFEFLSPKLDTAEFEGYRVRSFTLEYAIRQRGLE